MYHRYFNLCFTTATILEWKHLLRDDDKKDVVIAALRFLTPKKRAVVYAFSCRCWRPRQQQTVERNAKLKASNK